VTPTATRTATQTATRTVTSTRTVTPTPAPFLTAQIITTRGCLETGANPSYAIGETINVLYRVDGVIDGQAITQAQVTITDVVGGQGSVILSATRPAGQTLDLSGQAGPPVGTETLVIQAQAQGLPQTAQAQCSFHITQANNCMTACDCPTTQICNDQFTCQMGITPVYCCNFGPCPAGATCQFMEGDFSQCPGAP
jgi:hypothetical protein